MVRIQTLRDLEGFSKLIDRREFIIVGDMVNVLRGKKRSSTGCIEILTNDANINLLENSSYCKWLDGFTKDGIDEGLTVKIGSSMYISRLASGMTFDECVSRANLYNGYLVYADATVGDLPLPFASRHEHAAIFHSIEKYRSKILDWHNSSMVQPAGGIDLFITIEMKGVIDRRVRQSVEDWLCAHKDKVVPVKDLSAYVFFIKVDNDKHTLIIEHSVMDTSNMSYPKFNRFDRSVFESMNFIDRLNWMYNNCEFIPMLKTTPTLNMVFDEVDYTSYK